MHLTLCCITCGAKSGDDVWWHREKCRKAEMQVDFYDTVMVY